MTREVTHACWRGDIRASVRRRGSGVIVSIRVADVSGWPEVVKIDAVGRAHWHLYTRNGGEHVHRLSGSGVLEGGDVILDELPEHLSDAGYPDVAAHLGDGGGLVRLRADIDKVIEALNR